MRLFRRCVNRFCATSPFIILDGSSGAGSAAEAAEAALEDFDMTVGDDTYEYRCELDCTPGRGGVSRGDGGGGDFSDLDLGLGFVLLGARGCKALASSPCGCWYSS